MHGLWKRDYVAECESKERIFSVKFNKSQCQNLIYLVEHLTSHTSESKSANEPQGDNFGPPPCMVRSPARWAASLGWKMRQARRAQLEQWEKVTRIVLHRRCRR
jgi:hypothetical protein